MKMHVHATIAFAVFVLAIAGGCGETGPGPDEVLSRYLDASLHDRHTEAYEYLSASDQSVKSLEDYLSEQSEVDNPMAQVLANKVSYKIRSVTRDGDTADANVEVSIPDFATVFADVFGAALRSAFGDEDDQKEIEEVLAEKYKDNDLPMVTTDKVMHLTKDDGRWKVFLNWEAQAKVDHLMDEAQQLEKDKSLHAAKEKYQQALKLDGDIAQASKRIEELETEIVSFEGKQAYIGNVKLKNVHIGESVLGQLGVFGEVKNLGDRILTEVEITVYCLDTSGQPVYEEDFHPVLVSEFSLFGDNEPLKPNYSTKFGYSLEDAPSDWAGEVTVEVTDIEFAK